MPPACPQILSCSRASGEKIPQQELDGHKPCEPTLGHSRELGEGGKQERGFVISTTEQEKGFSCLAGIFPGPVLQNHPREVMDGPWRGQEVLVSPRGQRVTHTDPFHPQRHPQ